MEKKKGKHWVLFFTCEKKWIKLQGIMHANCHCGTYSEKVLMFSHGIEIVLCAQNKAEEKELSRTTFLFNVDKYDVDVHLLESGVDY